MRVSTISPTLQVERNLLQNKDNLFEAHASLSGSLHGAFSGEEKESPKKDEGAENGRNGTWVGGG